MDIFAVEAYTASWIEINIRSIIFIALNVEAYTASWIEIYIHIIYDVTNIVEAYTASWIEISVTDEMYPVKESKPIRLRGLK